MTGIELSFYRNKKVVVTGAFGFIGSHLLSGLKESGAEIIATGLVPVAGDFQSVRLDVRDADAVGKLIGDLKPDLIFNLAGKVGGDRSPSAYTDHIDISVSGALNLAKAALDNAVAGFVQIGSSEEYGGGPIPFQESQHAMPVSPYSASKLSATECLLAAWRSFQLPVVVVRPTVAYGPRQKPVMLVPHLFQKYLKGHEAVLTAGEQTRDFIYVDDVVAGLLAAGARPDLAGEIFNLCSAEEISVKDLAARIARFCNYEGELGLGRMPYRKPLIMRHVASPDKARKELGFTATVPIDAGLKQTLDWWTDGSP